MYNEFIKAGLTEENLASLSYKTDLEKSLVNSLRHFDKKNIMKDIQKMIRFYNELELLDDLAIDYRIKSIDSCLRKYALMTMHQWKDFIIHSKAVFITDSLLRVWSGWIK